MAGVLSLTASRMVITDMYPPSDTSAAYATMQTNLGRLRVFGYKGIPMRDVDAFALNGTALLKDASIVVATSPAGHDNDGTPTSHMGCQAFKQNLFYKLCFDTGAHQTVVMTYCPSAIPSPKRLELWLELDQSYLQGRTIIATLAHCRQYRCHVGLEQQPESLLGDDVGVLICLPMHAIPLLVITEGKLDIADTIHRILQESAGQILTLGAYTYAFEIDVSERSLILSGPAGPDVP